MFAETGNTLINARTKNPIPLVMQRLDLTGRATPAGAYLRVTHQFKCEGSGPMEALYVFQLPTNGTLRRFIVKGDGFEVESKLSPREEARKEYEEGVEQGHLSVLAETTLDGMVTLAVGQVKPDEFITVVLDLVVGVEVADQKYRFRFPFTLCPNYHAKAKVVNNTVELPSDVFGDLVLPEWKTTPDGLHQVSFKMTVEAGNNLDSVSSPSHRILVRPWTNGMAEVELAGGGDVPNRDLVLDIVSKETAQLVLADDVLVTGKTDKDDPNIPAGSPRWSALVPSNLFPKAKDTPRRVCFLMDRSGSMNGDRIESARIALNTCISGLDPNDEFGLVVFDTEVDAYDKGVGKATKTNRDAALKWLQKIDARGGTELAKGLGAAVEVLGAPGYDIFLITDGDVAGTGPIIEQCAASGTRIHVLGIGAASQDRFLSAIARRTGGVSEIVGPKEDVATKTLVLFNAVRQPVQKDVKALVTMQDGTTQAHEIETVYQNRPAILTDDGKTQGLPASIKFTFGSDDLTVDLTSPRTVQNGLVALLWAGRQVEDAESALDMMTDGPGKVAINQELKDISTRYGLASRAMSLCAVVKRFGDQAGVAPEQKLVPVGLPEDMPSGSLQQSNFYSPCLSTAFLHLPNQVPGVYGLTGSSAGISRGFSSNSSYGSSFSGASARGIRRSVRLCAVAESPQANSAYLSTPDAAAASFSLCSDDGLGESLRGCGFGEPIETLVEEVQITSSTGISLTGQNLMLELAYLDDDGGLFPMLDAKLRGYLTLFLALALLKQDAETGQPIYTQHLHRMADFLEKAFPNLSVTVFSKLRTGTIKVEGEWETLYRDAKKTKQIADESFVSTLA